VGYTPTIISKAAIFDLHFARDAGDAAAFAVDDEPDKFLGPVMGL
jgi:hypothetical protein